MSGSLGTRLDRLEQRAGLAFADGPLGEIMVNGGQGRTPAEIARVALAHVFWAAGSGDPPAMSDQERWQLLTRLRDSVFHRRSKDEQ